MRKTLIATTCALALAAASPLAAKTLVIGLDASGSNPLMLNDDYAGKIAQKVGARVRDLDYGDIVVLETFGYHGQLVGQRAEIKITKRHRSKQVAGFVRKIVAALPTMVREEVLKPHGATNIISYLRTRAAEHGCDDDLSFVLASDGIEASDMVSEKDLREGKASLPQPESRFLTNCEVTILGVGAGRQSRVSKRLADEWKVFLEAAGAEPIWVYEG